MCVSCVSGAHRLSFLPAPFDDFPSHPKHFYCFPAGEAEAADGSQSHAATPHPVQPDPAHAHLRWLLSFRTDSACLPQLSNTHAGRGPDQDKKEPLIGSFSGKTKAYYIVGKAQV